MRNILICAFYYCISSGFTLFHWKILNQRRKKNHDTGFTEVLLFFRLVEMLRNGSEEEYSENFRLPSWRSGVFGMVQKKSKIRKIRPSFCSFILAGAHVRTSFPAWEKALLSL